MSRSRQAPWFVDGANRPHTKHERRKKAARAHRHHENTKIAQNPDEYVDQPSRAYTNPYDICDFKVYAPDDHMARRK